MQIKGHLKKVTPTAVPVDETQVQDDTSFLPVPESVMPNPETAPVVPDVELPVDNSPIQDLHSSLSSTDPNHNAKVIDLSQKFNQPAPFVASNLPQVEKAANAPHTSFFAELEKEYPNSTKFLADPKNMAVAHDDLQNVADHESILQKFTSSIDAGKAALETGSLQEELAFIRYRQANDQPIDEGRDFFRLGGQQAIRSGITASDPEERAQQIAARIAELEKNRPTEFGLKKGLYGAAEFIPQIIGGLGYGAKYGLPAAGVTGLASIWSGPIAGITAGAAGTAGFTAGEAEYNYKLMTGMSYDQLLKIKDVNGNPLPDNVAKIAATATGIASAGLSFVKLNTLLDTIPGGKDFLAKFTASAGQKVLENPETFRSALKTFAGNYVKTVAHGVGAMEGITAVNIAGTEGAKIASGQPFEMTSPSEVATSLKDTAIDAALTFVVMGFPGTVASLGQDAMLLRKSAQAKEFYTALGDTAKASKLRERLPDAHKNLVNEITKDSPVQDIYIPIQAAEEYFQSKGIDPEKAMSELGVSDSYTEAKSTGGDIKVPLATWTDKIVGTEHYQNLANDIKFNPEDLTANEAEAKKAEIAQKMAELDKESQAAATPAQTGESGQKISEDIAAQLKAAGLSSSEVRFDPKLHESFFNTLGEKLGVDPYELYQKYGLKIEGGKQAPDVFDMAIEANAKPQESMAAQGLDQQAMDQLHAETLKSSKKERIALAKNALESIPDVSTDQVAEALNLPKNEVRLLGNKKRAKGAQLGTYSKEEILAAATGNQRQFNQSYYQSPFSNITKVDFKNRVAEQPKSIPKNIESPEAVSKFNANVLDISKLLPEKKIVQKETMLDSFKTRFGGEKNSKKIDAEINKAQDSRKGPYVPNKDIKGVGFIPNFSSEPTGIIGEGRIQQSHDLTGKTSTDPLAWYDSKYGATKDLIEKHAAENKQLTINTSSDLIARDDYLSSLPKDTIVNMYVGTRNDDLNRNLFPGNPSRLRQENAISKLNQSGIDVKRIEPNAGDVISAAGGEKIVAEKLGIKEAEVKSTVEKALGPKLSVVEKQFYQTEGEAKGRIRFTSQGMSYIDLFKSADQSTFLHESGHYFLNVLGDVAMQDAAPEALKKDFKDILNFLGVESKDQIKVDQHEKFARAFESYLTSGEAPSEGLRSAFKKFKDWLLAIYKSASNLNVEMTPEIKGVFDRMLASEDEIKRAQKSIGYEPLEIPGLNVADAESLKAIQVKARDMAEAALLKEQMPELKAEHKAFLESERTRITEESKKAVNELPLFSAMDEIKKLTANNNIYDLAAKALSGKLQLEKAGHFEAVAETHGFASGAELAHAIDDAKANDTYNKEVKNRVDAGMAVHADMMKTDKIREAALQVIHDKHMIELIALERSIVRDLADQQKANAEQRKAKTEANQAANKELSVAVRKFMNESKLEASAARDNARQILAAKSIKDAGNFRVHVTNERNAAIKAAKAMAAKDYEKAAQHKQEQMLSHALASEAMKNRTETQKTLNYLSKFSKRGSDLLNMPFSFTRQIDSLLSKFGLSEPSIDDVQTMTAMAQQMLMAGEDPAEIANRSGYKQDASGSWVPETLPDFVARVNDNYYSIDIPDSIIGGMQKDYNKLTMKELRDLKDATKTIADTGKRFNRSTSFFDKAEYKEAADNLRKNIESTIGKPYEGKLQFGSQFDSSFKEKISKILELPDFIIPDLVNVLTLTHFLDGGKDSGPAKDYIYRPLKEAEDRKFKRYETMTKAVNDILSKHYDPKELADYKNQRYSFPELGRTLTKEEILAMALNWGNEGNKDRLRRGFKLEDAAFHNIFEKLDAKDWHFAQDAWDHLDTYFPEIAALEMKVNGTEVSRVEPSPFQNQHGEFRGGYYPISYDFNRSTEAYINAEQKNALFKQFSTAKAHTDGGHAKERVTTLARPIRLSLDVFFNHLENVVHDLEYRAAVIDVNRFLMQADTKSSIINAIGIKGYKGIGDWLKAVASDQGEHLSMADKAFRWFRFNATFATLSYRIINFPMDIVGNIANSVWEIGPIRLAAATKDFLMSPHDTKEFVVSKSERMKQRATMRDRDVMEMSKKWAGKDSEFKKFGFFLQSMADEAVSIPLWAEVYKKNLSEHGEEKAKHIADETVARTVGSGSILDQVGAQRGPESKKILSMFYSYMNMMFNRCWLQGKMAGIEYSKGNNGAAMAIIAKTALYAWGLQSLNENFWRELAHNGQKDDENARKKRILNRTLQQPFGYVWVARDIANLAIDQATGQKNANFRVSPMEQAIETIVKPFGQGLYALGSGQHVDKHFAENSAKSAAYLIGYPMQLNNYAFNFIDWMQNNGELTWKDAISRRTKK